MDALRLNVVLNVADFDASVAFYHRVLGMGIVDEWHDEDNGPGCVLQAGEGRTIELFGPPYGARADRRVHAGTELALEVDDVEAWHEQLEAAGVDIVRELRHNPWGDRSFGIDDPGGLRIWILEATD